MSTKLDQIAFRILPVPKDANEEFANECQENQYMVEEKRICNQALLRDHVGFELCYDYVKGD